LRSGPSTARPRVRAPVAAASRLAAELQVNPLLAQLLLNRGLHDAGAARAFLDVSVDNLSSPFALQGMQRAVEILADAVRASREIVVYGDYDADGVTATSALIRVLRSLHARVRFYIPHRQTEGYGLHAAAVRRLAAEGARLVVAVDCGITATNAAVEARDAGVDLMILDHHLPLGELPPASAIVNPKLSAVATDYCAAGLALQACRGLLMSMGHAEIDPDLYSIAALGTVADSVSLRDDNRIIVAHGLRTLGSPGWPGLRALLAVAKAEPPIAVRVISHGLAPRLNAAGRLDDASIGVRLLTSDDSVECDEIASTLDRLNRERRALCDQVLAEAVEEVEGHDLAREPALVLAHENWHPGVVGIVASQLVERYYRPTVLIGIKDGVGKGSARSIPPLHLVQALSVASEPLSAYGGHAMAAGLTVQAGAIDEFRERFIDSVRAALSPDDLTPVVDVDAEITLDAVTPELCADLDRLAPFGQGNPPPRFLTRGLRAVGTRLVGGGEHLRLVVTDGGIAREAIAFRQGESVELLAFTQARVDLAYAVEIDNWSSERWPQLVVEHLWTPDVDLSTVAADTAGVLARLFARADDYLTPGAIDEASAFHTKVVGVTFEGRQALLPTVRAGDRLVLARDPGNPVDPHAIKVCLTDGRQLGFLRADLAARLAPTIDAGTRYVATAAALTGGGDRAWGLNVFVERAAVVTVNGDGHPTGVPAPDALARTVRAGLLRSRAPTPQQDAVLDAAIAGRSSIVRIGPGRGLVASTAIAALGVLARGEGPVTIVLPRAAEVDAWTASIAPWLKALGVSTWPAHGAMPARSISRVSDALARGTVDVLIASAVWMIDRAPQLRRSSRVRRLVHVVDESTADDVTAVQDALGRATLHDATLVLGPLAASGLHERARVWGIDAVVDLAAPRTNIRIVDHRGRGPWSLSDSPAGRLEVSVLIATGPRESVSEARRLREQHPARSDRIAYYHGGLPAALRRVLEDLLAAGKLELVVTGALLVSPAMPAGVARVVAAGLPPTRLLAAEGFGAVGAGRALGVVELRYDAETLAAANAAVHGHYPSRDTLVRCYHFFRSLQGNGPWQWPSESARRALPEAAPGLAESTVGAALEIFVEAGIIVREGLAEHDGSQAGLRYNVADPAERVDLERSLRFREGVRAQAAWREVKAWAAGSASAILGDVAGA
jgi:single-stranded-DNA-specific exonuclease